MALQRAMFRSFDHFCRFSKGVQRLGQTQQSKVFGLPCNALQQSIHCNNQVCFGTEQIQFESGPMQFLLKIDCCQQSWRSVWKQKIHFNEMEMNCTVSSLTERSVKFVCKTNKLLRRWTTLIRALSPPPCVAICCTFVAFCCNIFVLLFVSLFVESVVHGFVEKSRSDRFHWIHRFSLNLGQCNFCWKLIVVSRAEGLSGNRRFILMKWKWIVLFPVWPKDLWSLFVKQTNYSDVEQRSSE